MVDGGVDDRSGGPTFRMDRRSPEASKLKAAVLRKLLQFLADYSDDVLAEYIVVLVCNGKTQTQAGNDLRDFLGHDSGHFVSWLWDYLSHEILKPSKHMEIPKSGRESETKPLAAHSDNPLSDRYQPSASPSPPSGPNTLKHTRPPLPDSENERELTIEKTEVTLQSYEASGSKSSAQNCGSASCQGHQPAAYGVQCPICECSNQKVARRNSDEQPSPAQYVPKKGVVIKKQRAFSAESFQDAEGRTLSTTLDREAHHNQRRRGNVWDRLGKPILEEDAVLAEKKGRLITDVVKRRRLEVAELPTRSLLRATTDPTGQSTKLNQSVAEQAFKVEKEAPIKHKGAQQMNKYTLDEKKSVVPQPTLGKQTVEPAGVINHDHQVNGNSESQFRRENQVINTLQRSPLHDNNLILSISDPPENSGSGTASRRPIEDEVSDVKSRLHQIELEMLTLRSRQAEMCSSIKPKSLLGVHNLDEDVDSRTVIVTNVHFAASKEAVVSYFAKCGDIVKVVLLTNTITAQLKGTAYVTFASKESVEKAVMLSGTSFYSRILTVLRKAEAPARLLVPSGKPSRPCITQQVQRQGGSLQRHRLQWVRNQPGKGAEVAAAVEHGIEAFSCTE